MSVTSCLSSCPEQPSRCSSDTARTAHVPPHQRAQSVIVEDNAGFVMAFVPAHKSVKLAPISASYPTLMPAPQLRLRPLVLAL